MKNNKKNNAGLSLLEALISMVVVGIGFVAILQITQYSINSVKTCLPKPNLLQTSAILLIPISRAIW